jgi:hypothetical protein
VRRTRLDIEDLLEDSPSLRRTVGAVIAKQLPGVRELIAATLARYGETLRVTLEGLSHDAASVLGDFLPEGPDGGA